MSNSSLAIARKQPTALFRLRYAEVRFSPFEALLSNRGDCEDLRDRQICCAAKGSHFQGRCEDRYLEKPLPKRRSVLHMQIHQLGMSSMFSFKLAMITSDPTRTSNTMSTPNASARMLLVLSGPVVMWRRTPGALPSGRSQELRDQPARRASRAPRCWQPRRT